MHRSSMCCSAVRANSSLTSMPLWPYFLNANGEPSAAPVLRSVRRFGLGSGLPWYFVEHRLGVEGIDVRRSAVHEQVDDLPGLAGELGRPRSQRTERPGRCRRSGARGGNGPSDRSSASTPARPISPNPMPHRPSRSRRVRARRGSACGVESCGMAGLLRIPIKDATPRRGGARRPRRLVRARGGRRGAWCSRSPGRNR